MQGIYLLIIELKSSKDIEIGALGETSFQAGDYIYVGSAQKGVEGRVRRHLSDEKTLHWHIDYLLEEGEVQEVYAMPGEKTKECEVAKELSSIARPIPNFGCSDCHCGSHLFYREEMNEAVDESMEKEDLEMLDTDALRE